MTTALFSTSTSTPFVSNSVASPSLDPLLIPFIHAPDERRASAHLESLIHEYADPVIAAAVRRYARTASNVSAGTQNGDGADVRGETIRVLLHRVGAIRYAGACPIGDFLAYVKVTARHSCWQHSRKSQRERPFSSFGTQKADNAADGASAFEEITEAIAALSGPAGICSLIEQRGMLRAVWEEVCTLPRMQRMALLYNFRDKNGANALPLLPLCNVTTPTELATALDVPAENLEEFLEQLPMEDSRIAERIGASAREIINLRVAARRRLTRRVRTWLEPAA